MLEKAIVIASLVAFPLAGCGDAAKKADTKVEKTAKKDDEPKANEDPDAGQEDAVEPSLDSPEGRVALAALVAGEISQTPDEADEILEKNGLDREKLDELMYEIAKDPELSQAYKERRMAS
jgi:hypothetical protein